MMERGAGAECVWWMEQKGRLKGKGRHVGQWAQQADLVVLCSGKYYIFCILSRIQDTTTWLSGQLIVVSLLLLHETEQRRAWDPCRKR